jgi:hypothetical protein
VLTELLAAGVTGYFIAGWPGMAAGVVLPLLIGGEVTPAEHRGVLSIAVIVGLFLIGGVVAAIVGVIGLAVLAMIRSRQAVRAHHAWLEPRVARVLQAYDDGRLDDMIAALDQIPFPEAFNNGLCKTCLPLLERVERARRDLGSARWFVIEYRYSLAEAWVIVREYGSDRQRYEQTRQRASTPSVSVPLPDTTTRHAAARAAIERAQR